jgi:hypothetical protein
LLFLPGVCEVELALDFRRRTSLKALAGLNTLRLRATLKE